MGSNNSRPKRFNCRKCGRPINHRGNCFPCNKKAKWQRENTKKEESTKKSYSTYKDKRGYDREYPTHTNLIHRRNAYKYIYLKNRDEYPDPFSSYDVHHIDGDKNNNHSSNLKIVTREEHKKIHEQERVMNILQSMRPWERKKWIANNYGDFSLIRMLFISDLERGDRIIEGLKFFLKYGLIGGIVLVVASFIFRIPGLINIGKFLIGIGVLAFFAMIILSIIGWIYNKIGNFWDHGKKVFGK